MNNITKRILFTAFVILSLYACKKENEEVPTTQPPKEDTGTTTDDSLITVAETCSDGILNQDETAVDCGGVCDACPLSARDSALLDYNTNYLGSEVNNLGWTGNISVCNEGTLSEDTHNKVIQRINYFRRLVGLNDDCEMDESKHHLYQKAALVMAANSALDHYPPSSWSCWTQDAYDGATSSNLSLTSGTGYHSVEALTGQIRDAGANNTSVGHRRWILYSKAVKFAHGSTPKSMSLGVIGLERSNNNKVPEFIAYPPADYIPQTLVFNRWSFAIPGAQFRNATVQMQDKDGKNIPLTIVSNDAKGQGDNTLVWEPQGIETRSQTDLEFNVTIRGILNAPETSYTYTVIITTVVEPVT